MPHIGGWMTRAPQVSFLQGDNHLETSDWHLWKRHFITNTQSAHILASEWQMGAGRGGNVTGSEDQPAATGKQSTGVVKLGGCIITMNKVPAKQDDQLLAFRRMLASIEQIKNLLILIFIQFPGAKSKF